MSEPQFSFKAEHLETLYEITRYLNSSLDLGEVLEYVMDRVVQVTGAERGFLVLLDLQTHRLTFPFARGMGRIDLTDPEFQVSQTIIQEVIATNTPLLTVNAQHDKRFADGSSIISKGLRSILCVPISVRDEIIGLVYVDNRFQSGLFNETHRDLLAAFAQQAGTAIENARLYQLAVEKGRIERELQMAYQIQRDLLPVQIEILAGYEIAFEWRAAREVAGDFYDCFLLDNTQMGVVVADVADKGVPAAIYMAVSRSILVGNAYGSPSPEETLRRTNQLLLKYSKRGMFVTMYYTVFAQGGLATCVNAGHNCPIYFQIDTRQTRLMPRGGRALGWFEEMPVEAHFVQMQAGDALVFYTDGLTEAENPAGEAFGDQRLSGVIREYGGHSAEYLKDKILQAFDDFVGNAAPYDDITLVVVRFVGEE